VSNELKARATRYETIIATLVGVSALFVSGYTAHVQRQQVRAAVWPILEFNTSNEPMIKFTLDNKGVGPAIIRHVVVTVDGQPVRNWQEAIEKLLGPDPLLLGVHDHYKFSESTMSGHVLAANQSIDIMVPHDDNGGPLDSAHGGPLWDKMNKERARVSVEICYCSTLGDCWLLRSDGNASSTNSEASGCPAKSATTFQQ
jgi:hypothetical protein